MENNEIVPGLCGSLITKNKMVGYCTYHHAALTVKTMKGHECLRKQCNSLQKCMEHDFWRQHQQIKDIRKAKRQQTINIENKGESL